jgi:hypothetical protein
MVLELYPKDFKCGDIIIFLSFGCIEISSCEKDPNVEFNVLKDSYVIKGDKYEISNVHKKITTSIQDKQYLVIRKEN